MEEKKYRVYAEEFKLQALEMLKQGEKSAGEIERNLGITLPKSTSNRQRETAPNPKYGFRGRGYLGAQNGLFFTH